MKKIRVGRFSLDGLDLKYSDIYKLRGYIGNVFEEYDLIHNHNDSGNIYRYPLVQFKIVNYKPTIITITEEAIDIFSTIFNKLDKVVIDNVEYKITRKQALLYDVSFGYVDALQSYKFVSPWLALNQRNYKLFQGSDDREHLLEGILKGNILSMSKTLEYWLEPNQRLKASFGLNKRDVYLKGKRMLSFTGDFKVNFIIPNFFGLGKSVSRGFGITKKMKG